MRTRSIGLLCGMFTAASLLLPTAAVAADTTSTALSGPAKLFNGKDLSGWKPFLDPKANAKPEDVWSIKDGVIICKGHIMGYLRGEKSYGNYRLKLEWKWGETGDRRNSGVFVHVSGSDKVWPKGAEAQLQSGSAGDFWLVDGFKLNIDRARKDPKSDRHYFRMQDAVEKPIGEWNQYEIVCDGDKITLMVNGKKVNEGTGAEASSGDIILQSEGAEIHFRNITVEPLGSAK